MLAFRKVKIPSRFVVLKFQNQLITSQNYQLHIKICSNLIYIVQIFFPSFEPMIVQIILHRYLTF
jgi:hypothetical protein